MVNLKTETNDATNDVKRRQSERVLNGQFFYLFIIFYSVFLSSIFIFLIPPPFLPTLPSLLAEMTRKKNLDVKFTVL